MRNDDSIVLELRWRDVSVLLTGDIGRAVEREIGAAIPPARAAGRQGAAPRQPDVELAGVRASAVRPRVAVVSAGRGNHFGHPVPEVLERYRAVGAEIFRTDRDGAVTVDTDGYSLDVRTFTGRRLSLSLNATTKTRRTRRPRRTRSNEAHATQFRVRFPTNSKQLVHATIGCCIAVHRELGPGCSRASTRAASCIELERSGHSVRDARRLSR